MLKIKKAVVDYCDFILLTDTIYNVTRLKKVDA